MLRSICRVSVLVPASGYRVSCTSLTAPSLRFRVTSDGTYRLTYRLESSL
jgi:hypothetical protein